MTMAMALTLAACRKENSKPQWDVDLLAPIFRSTLTIRDLAPDSLFEVGPDGFITLIYSDRLFVLDLDTLLAIPDTAIAYDYVWPFGPVNLPAGTTLPTNSDATNFELDGMQLRLVELREGVMDLTLRNQINSVIIGTFSLPGANYQGNVLSVQQTVLAGTPGSPSLATVQRNIGGYRFDLTGPAFNTYNTLATLLNLQLDPNGSGALLTNQDSISAIVAYQGLVPQYAKGYFGQRTVHIGPETSDFRLFDAVIAGAIDLQQVGLRIVVTNGVGADMRVRLAYLRARNSSTGASADLAHPIVTGPININRALDLGWGFQAAIYENLLTESNSNVDQMIELMPDAFDYELDLEVNPLGNISNGNDFLYYDSELEARAELEVPLSVIVTGLTLQQSLPSGELPGSAEAHALMEGELMLHVLNGFPLAADLALEIVNDEGVVWSVLPVTGAVAPGILGADGLVQSAVRSKLTTRLTPAQVDLLYVGGRIRVRTVLNTSDQTQHLRLLDSYRMEVQLTARARYMVNGNE